MRPELPSSALVALISSAQKLGWGVSQGGSVGSGQPVQPGLMSPTTAGSGVVFPPAPRLEKVAQCSSSQ